MNVFTRVQEVESVNSILPNEILMLRIPEPNCNDNGLPDPEKDPKIFVRVTDENGGMTNGNYPAFVEPEPILPLQGNVEHFCGEE